MEVHKPKPSHNLREFLSEIAVVVCGVLIALSAEQIVEAAHWAHEVHAGSEALKEDFKQALLYAAERRVVDGCVNRRLDEVATTIDAASKSKTLAPLGAIDFPPGRLWRTASWDSLVASQTAVHFPRAKMLQYSKLAHYLDSIGTENEDEYRMWSRLNSIVGPGRSFGEAEEADLRQTLGQTRAMAFEMNISAHEIAEEIKATGLLSAAEFAEAEKPVKADAYPICRPIGAIPGGYGLAALTHEKRLGLNLAESMLG